MAWLLPDSPAVDYVCVKISIPNTQQDIRNFIGSILNLAQWFNYERTNTSLASQVADTWLITLNELLIGACMTVRQSPTEPCILQSSTDGGDTWDNWADITLCVNSDYIENLISTTPSLQTLIQNTIIGTPSTGGIAERISSEAFDSATCDNDAMYGYSKAMWQYINANTLDALQIVAEATNASEQLSKILTSVIPGLELLPVDEVLGWIESFGNYNLEAYEASITVGLEQEIICDIFCLAVDNGCTLTFDVLFQYFIDKMGGVSIPTAFATLAEWIQFMVIGSYPNDRIVYLWSAFQLALAFMGQEFLGLSTLGRYALVAQAGDPDNEWSLLCDPCNDEWTYSFDFVADNTPQGWTAFAGRGALVAGGWQRTASLPAEVQIQRTWSSANITSIEMYNSGLAQNCSGYQYQFRANDVSGSVYSNSGNNSKVEFDITSTGFWVSLCVQNSPTILIQKIVITGKGFNPFI